VVDRGPELEEIRRFYAEGPLHVREESRSTVRAAIVIDVERVDEVRSLAGNIPEDRLRRDWLPVHLGTVRGGEVRPASGGAPIGAVVTVLLGIPALIYEVFDWFVWNNRPPVWTAAVAVVVAAAVAVAGVVAFARRRGSRRPSGWSAGAPEPVGRSPEVVLRDIRLVHVATVGEDGGPHVAPMGTAIPWRAGLAFAVSPGSTTAANLRRRPGIHVNVVDPVLRKGYRFHGTAAVHDDGPARDAVAAALRGEPRHVRAEAPEGGGSAVVLERPSTKPLISPGYRGGVTEEQMRRRWREHYGSVEGTPSDRRAAAVLALASLAGLGAGIALFIAFGRGPLTPWYEGLPWAIFGAMIGIPAFGIIPLRSLARRAGKSA
jgi:hypothetical protein